ncbi:MAG: glycosyl hydrolase family 28-related protein [Mucilaginibacter sp.]
MENTRFYLLTTCFMLILLPAHFGCAARPAAVASPNKEVAGTDVTINIVEYGADNTGQVDCAKLVRKAQQAGNVYFPAGTYLMGPVDVMPNRKYFGAGMGKTIIKAKQVKIKMLWGISTYDFDKSGHPDRNIENVELSDMTLDYNFTNGWIDYYSMIIFKGHPTNYIRNIKIQRIEFINSDKIVHPDLTGKHGKDAWSINLSSFASITENVLVDKCVSNALSHQFVSGGGSALKHIVITNNYIVKPHANGITFTTVSDKDVKFEDFTVTGNTIIDALGSSILFGHDPGSSKFNGGRQTFQGLLVANNKIELSDHNLYGKSYRTKKSFPFVISLSGAEPYMKDVIIRDNEINVTDKYTGNSICLGKIKSYKFKRNPGTVVKAFKQPGVNETVEAEVNAIPVAGKPYFPADTYIKIAKGGLYKIVKTSGQTVTLKLTEWELEAQPGSSIREGSTIEFRGGMMENIQFIDNLVTGKKNLRMVPGGIISGFVFKGNNKVDFTMPYGNTVIDKAEINNNTNFSFTQNYGIINGTMSGNKLSKSLKAAKEVIDDDADYTGDAKLKQNNLKMINNN